MDKSFPQISSLLNALDKVIEQGGSPTTVMQKTSELLEKQVAHYDWVGFYLVDKSGENLVLGPYVGTPTDHVKIAFGRGVCGQVAISEMSRVIQDVSLENNYLSCSSNVQSEVVFPIMKKGKVVAELDIDSHAIAPFTEKDTELLEAVCSKLTVLF